MLNSLEGFWFFPLFLIIIKKKSYTNRTCLQRDDINNINTFCFSGHSWLVEHFIAKKIISIITHKLPLDLLFFYCLLRTSCVYVCVRCMGMCVCSTIQSIIILHITIRTVCVFVCLCFTIYVFLFAVVFFIHIHLSIFPPFFDSFISSYIPLSIYFGEKNVKQSIFFKVAQPFRVSNKKSRQMPTLVCSFCFIFLSSIMLCTVSFRIEKCSGIVRERLQSNKI